MTQRSKPLALSHEEQVHFVHAADGFRLALTEVVPAASMARRHGADLPVFLLVPGFAQNRAAFLRGEIPARFVERGARVLVGELRGHGRSACPADRPRNWSLADHQTLDLPALLEGAQALGRAARIHVVGHSMGGMLAVAALSGPLEQAIASVTTFAAPLCFQHHSAVVRLAALVAIPALRLARSVPMDRFLGALAPLLIARGVRGRLSGLLELPALASARTQDAAILAEILIGSEPESPVVLGALAEMAVRGRAVLEGVDLVEVLTKSPVPIAMIHGTHDVLAPFAGAQVVSSSSAGGSPRLVIEVADALHVDLVVGRHAAAIADELWSFLLSA